MPPSGPGTLLHWAQKETAGYALWQQIGMQFEIELRREIQILKNIYICDAYNTWTFEKERLQFPKTRTIFTPKKPSRDQ